MLQYPINVKPENYAIDATEPYDVSFTFNGDALWGLIIRISDYDTGEIVVENTYTPNSNKPIAYNGDTVTRRIPANSLENGKDYILQMMFMQRKENGELIYDMPVVGGSVDPNQKAAAQKNILVAPNMTSIYSWGHDGSGYYYPTKINDEVFAGAVIKIGNESRFIKMYSANGTKGTIRINESFSTILNGGEKYQIYSNYIITPQYFFSCRSKPEITLEITAQGEIYCNGTYSQTESSNIKYYIMKLHHSNNPTFRDYITDEHIYVSSVVEETDKVFSQKLSYTFAWCYRRNTIDPELVNDYYRVTVDVVTQDNFTYTATSNVIEAEPYYLESEYALLDYFDLKWDKDLGRVRYTLSGYCVDDRGAHGTRELFRTDLDTGEVVRVPTSYYNFASDEKGNEVLVGEDMTASTHGRYSYDFYCFRSTGGSLNVPSDGVLPHGEIETNDYSYYISDLTEYTYTTDSSQAYIFNRRRFLIKDTWKFVADIQDSIITNNLDRQSYAGYSQYITSISTDVNYMSGTLTGALGQLNCSTKTYTDDIALVRAWRKFITQKKPFLLKSQKGDVWIVNVIENPTTTYQENTRGVPTTFSFTWAEICNPDDVVITSWGRGN